MLGWPGAGRDRPFSGDLPASTCLQSPHITTTAYRPCPHTSLHGGLFLPCILSSWIVSTKSKMTSKDSMMADIRVILLTASLLTCCTITPTVAYHEPLLPCQVKQTQRTQLSPLFDGQRYGHYVQYSVENSIPNSSACGLSIEDLLCRDGCESQPNETYVHYQRLDCKGGLPFQIVFNNDENIHLDHISFLDLAGCEVSLLNVGVYGEATDLKVLTFEKCIFIDDPSINSSIHLNFSDIIPGLGSIVSLTVTSGDTGNIQIPHELLNHKWSAVAELDLQMVTTSKQQLDILRQTMPNLQSLYVKKCHISELPDFPWNSALQILPNNLSRSEYFNSHYAEGEGLILEPHLTRRMISIKENNLPDLSSYQFKGRLDKIVLTSNQIHELGQDIFAQVSHLQILILKSNLLRKLPIGVFRNLHSLTELDLSSNNVAGISEDDFKGLQNLKVLNIANNSLFSISTNTFSQLRMLATLDLSDNFILKFADDSFGYSIPNTFVSINLDKNNMTNFPAWIFTTRNLRKIHLSGNRISFEAFVRALDGEKDNIIAFKNTESASSLGQLYKPHQHKIIDLSYNNFTTLDFEKVLSSKKKKEFTTILNFFLLDLEGNDIDCDCHTYSMYQFLNEHRSSSSSNDYSIPRVQKFYYDEWKCSKPNDVHGKPIMDLANDTFVCQKDLVGCPQTCVCLERAVDGSVIVNCSGQGLKYLPQQVPNLTDTLLFSHNIMTNLKRTSYLESLKTLDVSFNLIKTIADDTVFALDQLSSVKLHDNKLEMMPSDFKYLQHVHLTLGGNFFICDCHMKWAVHWIFSYRMNIKDIDKVVCTSGVPRSTAIYQANQDDFICKISRAALTGIAIGVPILLILVIVSLVLCFLFRGEIKVLMYYHFNWHPFDRNRTDVVDKLYDAFVSYNKADTHWVLKTLQPTLESDHHPFRLCMEVRDFRPGGLITDNILYSVKYSRRSIMLLTRSYLKNEWCRYEFKSAHHKVLKDRTNYLIVILFDGLDLDDLDEEMKLYMKTNTYIKHDSKLFWQRILYAMPEKPLSVLREESFPSSGYETLFPSPESVTIMQIIQHKQSLAMNIHDESESSREDSDSEVDSDVGCSTKMSVV